MRLLFSPVLCYLSTVKFKILRQCSLCLCYHFGRGFLSMGETVICSILVLCPFYLCVHNRRVNKQWINSFSNIPLLLSLQSVGINDSLQISEFYSCFCCSSRRGKAPSSVFFKFQLMHIVDKWLKHTMGMAMTSQLLLPSLNCKTYDCSIKISCKFFSYGEFSL